MDNPHDSELAQKAIAHRYRFRRLRTTLAKHTILSKKDRNLVLDMIRQMESQENLAKPFVPRIIKQHKQQQLKEIKHEVEPSTDDYDQSLTTSSDFDSTEMDTSLTDTEDEQVVVTKRSTPGNQSNTTDEEEIKDDMSDGTEDSTSNETDQSLSKANEVRLENEIKSIDRKILLSKIGNAINSRKEIATERIRSRFIKQRLHRQAMKSEDIEKLANVYMKSNIVKYDLLEEIKTGNYLEIDESGNKTNLAFPLGAEQDEIDNYLNKIIE